MNGEAFRAFAAVARAEIDAVLDDLLPPASEPPRRLHEAMRYPVFAGGKRLRPLLVLVAGELFGAPRARLAPGAAAIEAIHTYSLVHDDLPALDDDDLRRGRPTVHRAFDEATAILVGDALLTFGLTTLARLPEEVPAATRARAAALVGEAIGTGGMIGGQVEDLAAEADWPAEPAAALERIHRGKTAALLGASLRLGGLYAGVDEAADRELATLGGDLGLLFQIRDDLLDVEGTPGEIGKTPGKDARRHKLTYPELYGAEESRRRMREVAEAARARAEALAGRAAPRSGHEAASLPPGARPASAANPDAKLLTSLIAYLTERSS
jgi:geranylgeranyl pyrophosphate synthase